MTTNINLTDEIKKSYESNKQIGSFLGVNAFVKNDVYKNQQVVERALRSLDSYTKFKPARKNFKRQRVIVRYAYELFAADLLDYQKYKHSNRGYAWIAVFYDAFTKMIYCRPLKTKSAIHVSEALEDVFRDKSPDLLLVDMGKEWFNGKCQSIMKEKGIKMFATKSPTKSFYAENCIRRLKRIFERIFYITKRKTWLFYLDDVVFNLNRTYSQPIKMTPVEASKPENQAQVFYNLYKNLKRDNNVQFKVFDKVRLSNSRFHNIFSKKYKQSFSDEIYTIIKVNVTPSVPTFLIQDQSGVDIDGQFYQEELQKVFV